MDEITKIMGTVNSVLKLDKAGAIIKMALMACIVGFTVWWSIRGKKIKIDQARAEEDRNDQINHDTAVNQNRTDNNQVGTDSQRTDDFFQGE